MPDPRGLVVKNGTKTPVSPNTCIEKLPIPIDVIPESRAIESGELSEAIAGLEAELQREIRELDRRLSQMILVLQEVNRIIEGLLKLF